MPFRGQLCFAEPGSTQRRSTMVWCIHRFDPEQKSCACIPTFFQKHLICLKLTVWVTVLPKPIFTRPKQFPMAQGLPRPPHCSSDQAGQPSEPSSIPNNAVSALYLPNQQTQGGQQGCRHKDHTTPNKMPHRVNHRWGMMAHQRLSSQMRLNTKDPLVPPKPKLFLRATSIFTSRAVLAQ